MIILNMLLPRMSANEDEMPEEPDEEHSHHDDAGTTHSNYRWKWLATALALFVGIGFPTVIGLHAVGYVDVTSVPQWAWVPITSGWMGILFYAFGEDIKKAWKK